jgi:O-antigen biosynthesis protein
MKILFFRNDFNANAIRQVDDKYGGVGYYRIVQPAKYLKGHQVDIIGADINKKGKTREEKWNSIFKEYDVVWTSYFSDPQEASAIFYHRDKYNKKIVIDLDDNYLDISPTHRLYDKFKETKKDRAFLSTILTFADAITVSTEPLKQRIAEHIKKVYQMEKPIFVIPNMNEMSDFKFKPAIKDKNKIVIGYAGSNSHYDDLQMVFPAISKIMDKYPQVHFEIVGSLSEKDAIELFKDFSNSAKDRCDLIPPTMSFQEYPKHLASMKWDIGIAPLVDTAFTRSKSHIKFMEYAMYKIPVIASRVYPYYVNSFNIEVITNGETGILCKPSEWEGALEEMILDKEKREQLGENAFKYVTENWQYNDDFSSAIDKVIEAL